MERDPLLPLALRPVAQLEWDRGEPNRLRQPRLLAELAERRGVRSLPLLDPASDQMPVAVALRRAQEDEEARPGAIHDEQNLLTRRSSPGSLLVAAQERLAGLPPRERGRMRGTGRSEARSLAQRPLDR